MSHRALLFLLALTGCARFSPELPAASAAPTTHAAAPASASVLTGSARCFGNALAGAALRVHPAGAAALAGSGATRADGGFQLTLGSALVVGSLALVVAEGGGHRVATLARVPARTVLARGELLLDEAHTLAWLTLDPAAADPLAALEARARQLTLGALADRQAFDAAVAESLDADDQPRETTTARDLVAVLAGG